ncbi:2'-5' RNA ligase family protein [Eubacterium oxidoreducens]|uniref:2'-5' RNA ligase n=1 Tax=Eubacterium oxidoreducens TaxID=1732 RepID=A0A1G6A523_EUBOX|nr:hypothetical protein [Eubacterium oxidoreducens]SDB03532.1 hypothetical protein SAMN02910417_00273 [Eubacterium oxidoreducens]
MYLISVYFDSATEKTLQRYIERIARMSGNNFMIEHQIRPHMTISAIESRSIEAIRPSFEALQDTLKWGTIQIVCLGQLLPYVFYAAPVLNEYLMDLSNRVYDAVKEMEDIKVSRYYQPYSWMPHITLAKKLDTVQMLKAFEAMQNYFAPMEGCITQIGLSRVRPYEDIVRFDLERE